MLDYSDRYPVARMLIIRKTRVCLTESALAIWENQILGQGHPVLGNPIQRTSRHQYLWRNTSVLVTGGMDKSDKVLSTEWDMIYCPECNELNVAEWETLNNRIRAMAGPYDLLFGNCNPTVPSHWICRLAKAKQLKLVSTQLQDNPQYYDEDSREWTELGRRYHTGWRVRTKSKSVKDDMLRRSFPSRKPSSPYTTRRTWWNRPSKPIRSWLCMDVWRGRCTSLTYGTRYVVAVLSDCGSGERDGSGNSLIS